MRHNVCFFMHNVEIEKLTSNSGHYYAVVTDNIPLRAMRMVLPKSLESPRPDIFPFVKRVEQILHIDPSPRSYIYFIVVVVD